MLLSVTKQVPKSGANSQQGAEDGLLRDISYAQVSAVPKLGGPSAMLLGFIFSVAYFCGCTRTESRSSWELFCLVFLQILLNSNTLYS